MSVPIVHDREPQQPFTDAQQRSRLEMCDEPGCIEWAQSSDPTCEDTLKFKCVKHEAAARARGENGIRPAPPTNWGNFRIAVNDGDAAKRTARNAEIQAELAAGRIPGQSPDTATGRRGDAANELPAHTQGKEPTMSRAILRRKVQCIESGEIFDSPTLAGKSIGLGSLAWCLAPSAKSNAAGGKHWRYADGPPNAGLSMTPGAIQQRRRRARPSGAPPAAPLPPARDLETELNAEKAALQEGVNASARPGQVIIGPKPSEALALDACVPSNILASLASALSRYSIEELKLSFVAGGRAINLTIEGC